MMFLCPAWLADIMQLTPMPTHFKFVLVGIALIGFVVSMLGEQYVLPQMAKFFGQRKAINGREGGKQKKKYKKMQEKMRF